ncbi:hypothetical protein Q9R29_08715 [Rothia sp. ARF10]|nr:hypothetical protein [Rothia sp. ARF10]
MTVGVGETERTAEPEGALARPVLRRVLAALVIASWVAWAVPSWMSSLHEVRPHEFVADVKSGRVTGYQVVANVRPDVLDFFALGSAWYADVPAADELGRPTDGPPRELIYTVDGGTRVRWLPETPPVVGELDPFAALSGSGAKPFTPETYPPSRDWAAFPALLGLGIALFSIVTLPPTLGTRPFWFLTGTVGMGLGILAYAVAELWWRRPPSMVAGTRGDDSVYVGDGAGRLRGWHGVGVALVGGLVVAAVRAAIT